MSKTVPIPSELNTQDEYYTPCYAVFPIVKYLKPKSRIWCPFDLPHSNFVRVLERRGFDVVHSHLSEGKDFFKMEVPEGTEAIVSNPPYSLKTQVLKRLFEIGKPFAMLVGCLGIFEATRFRLFEQYSVEVMVFDKRVSYFTGNISHGGGVKETAEPPFSSWYICHNLLPKQIVFERLHKTKHDSPDEVEQLELL